MPELTTKERSGFLNSWNRILIDFKSLLLDEEIVVYKESPEVIYYVLSIDNLTVVKKSGNFNALENNFLQTGDIVSINHVDLKKVSGLKKREVSKIFYDTEQFVIEYTPEYPNGSSLMNLTFVKNKDRDFEKTIEKTIKRVSQETIDQELSLAKYDKEQGLLLQDDKKYPFRITFSDDINHKLNVEVDESVYFIKLLDDETFIRIVTITKYKEVFNIFTELFAFNFYKQRNN